MNRKNLLLLGAAMSMLTFASAAQADYSFSGSGSSGTLVAPSETWTFNADGGAAQTDYLNNWGSPGVGLSVTQYGEVDAAFGMLLTFTGGGTINAASVGIGNSADCAGTTTGGTTFCTISPNDIWLASITGPSSISFLAQDSSFFLTQGQSYFVNVFFDGDTPTSFTGSWLTSFTPSVPEPSTWAMMLLGFGAIGFSMRWRKRSSQDPDRALA
jgi:hypothetical protein